MTFFVRVARKAALAIFLAATLGTAAPAYAADGAATAVAATEAAANPGFESLQDVVERAIAAPAADEILRTNAPAVAPAIAPAFPAASSEATIPATSPVQGADRRSLADLVSDYATAAPRDAEADCLASAVYFESHGEQLAGQLAVAEVIINRARSGRFASTLCGVVTQRSQFSFVRGGRIPSPPRSSEGWRTAVAIAHIALDDVADSPVSTALFFHARYVSPRWRLQRLAAVGNHIFYR